MKAWIRTAFVALAFLSAPLAFALAGDSTIHVVTYIDLYPNDANSGQHLILDEIRQQLKQTGCLRAEFLQEQGRPNHFMTEEIWKGSKELEAYHSSLEYRHFRDLLQPLLASPLDERRATELKP
jgi:quinol monooxygenase YgiN